MVCFVLALGPLPAGTSTPGALRGQRRSLALASLLRANHALRSGLREEHSVSILLNGLYVRFERVFKNDHF